MVTKVVQKAKGAEVVKAQKAGKIYRKKNKQKLNKAAKEKYQKMSHGEKMAHLEKAVFTRAMRHGATEAEAKKAVQAYKRNRKRRHAGNHAAEQRRQAVSAQKGIRGALKQKAKALHDGHKKALQKIRTAKVSPATRQKLRAAEKSRFSSARMQLAGERTKAIKAHHSTLKKIKTTSSKRGVFRLKDYIGNFKAQPISKQGKRLKTEKPKVGGPTPASIAEKSFGPNAKKPRKSKTSEAPAAPAAAAAPAKKTPGRPKKVVEAAAPAPAPAGKTRGRPKMTPEQKAAAKAAREAAKAPATKPAKTPKKPKESKQPKAEVKAPAATKTPKKPKETKAPAATKAPAKTPKAKTSGGATPKNKKPTFG